MDMHFIGLALLIGTIGIFDLRLLGFAQFIAASSLFLWFAVIILGRYIQLFEDSISSGSN